MFWSKENSHRNYSIIIIPERGSNTKTLKLSAKFFEITVLVILILMICIGFLIIQYFLTPKDISIYNDKNQYIQSLEKDNKLNQKKIQNYNKHQMLLQNKLNEIQQFEDSIKKKINKSISLKNIKSNNFSYIKTNTNNKNLINQMDNQIFDLSQIDEKLNEILKTEEYIPSILPCLGHISSYFGYRKNPFNEIQSDFHPGIDIACGYGTKVFAAASGTVTNAGYCRGYGNEVIIDHHNGLKTLYGHNSKICVRFGQAVKKGELISLSGSTGSSTGPHLHFEIRKNQKPIDPKEYVLKGVE